MTSQEFAAQIAKDLTITFADKLVTNTRRDDSEIADVVSEFFNKTFDTVLEKLR